MNMGPAFLKRHEDSETCRTRFGHHRRRRTMHAPCQPTYAASFGVASLISGLISQMKNRLYQLIFIFFMKSCKIVFIFFINQISSFVEVILRVDYFPDVMYICMNDFKWWDNDANPLLRLNGFQSQSFYFLFIMFYYYVFLFFILYYCVMSIKFYN